MVAEVMLGTEGKGEFLGMGGGSLNNSTPKTSLVGG